MSLPHSIWTCYRALHRHLADAPLALAQWLTPAELAELARLGDSGRRQQWLEARRLAKQLIQHATGATSLRDVQVLSRDARGLGVEPRVTVAVDTLTGETASWRLSISHSQRGVLLALAPADAFRVGVDLVESIPQGRRFEQAWFTARELSLLDDDRHHHLAQLWALKEAVYKAANCGDAWSPRHVEVLSLEIGSIACSYRGRTLDELQVEVRQIDGQTAVTACLPVGCLDNVSSATRSHALCS